MSPKLAINGKWQICTLIQRYKIHCLYKSDLIYLNFLITKQVYKSRIITRKVLEHGKLIFTTRKIRIHYTGG